MEISPTSDGSGFRNNYPSNVLYNTQSVHARFGWRWGARRREVTIKSPESIAYAKLAHFIVKGGSGVELFS